MTNMGAQFHFEILGIKEFPLGEDRRVESIELNCCCVTVTLIYILTLTCRTLIT